MSMLDLHKRALGAFGLIKAMQAASPDKAALIAPDRVPATIESGKFPKDFSQYKYVGPAIETVNYPLPDGKIEKRRGLVAELAHIHGDEAHSRVTMTASLRDLENGNHPAAPDIAGKLNDYHHNKVQSGTPNTPKRGALKAMTVITPKLNAVPQKPASSVSIPS